MSVALWFIVSLPLIGVQFFRLLLPIFFHRRTACL